MIVLTLKYAIHRMKKTKNYIQRARLVKNIVDTHFEPGAHRGCLRYVWRVYVHPVYPMSEATFYRMVEYIASIDGYIGYGRNRIEKPKRGSTNDDIDKRQMSLF